MHIKNESPNSSQPFIEATSFVQESIVATVSRFLT